MVLKNNFHPQRFAAGISKKALVTICLIFSFPASCLRDYGLADEKLFFRGHLAKNPLHVEVAAEFVAAAVFSQ